MFPPKYYIECGYTILIANLSTLLIDCQFIYFITVTSNKNIPQSGVQDNFRFDYNKSKMYCYVAKSVFNYHYGSINGLYYIPNHVLMNCVIKNCVIG